METPKGPIGKLESILTGTRHLMAITWSSLPRTSTIAVTKIVKKLAKTATEVPRLRKERLREDSSASQGLLDKN